MSIHHFSYLDYRTIFFYFYFRNSLTSADLMVEYFLVAALSYLIGSIPTAYIIVRHKVRLDIRNEGSGNVGAMNAYEVTGTKKIGMMVLAGDLLKGIAAILIVWFFPQVNSTMVATALYFVVIGHSFSFWLGLKGGRGLATAAGAMLLVGWLFVLVWCVLWLITHASTKNIHFGNIVATIVGPLIVAGLPDSIITFAASRFFKPSEFVLMVAVLCALLMITHIEPMIDLVKEWRVRNE